ncbi:hypothetical protein C0991_008934, partial [Blastosporella zonata]
VTPASNIDCLDYVFVSLRDCDLRENPRPDYLEDARVLINASSDVTASWSPNKDQDKTRQVFYTTDASISPSELKANLDNIFRSQGIEVLTSWHSDKTKRVTYTLSNPTHIINLLHQYPIINGKSYRTQQSLVIEPIYGLKVIVYNVNNWSYPRQTIEQYLQNCYGQKRGNQWFIAAASKIMKMHTVLYSAIPKSLFPL